MKSERNCLVVCVLLGYAVVSMYNPSSAAKSPLNRKANLYAGRFKISTTTDADGRNREHKLVCSHEARLPCEESTQHDAIE